LFGQDALDALDDMLIAKQIRAARALLGWSQSDLSQAANVGIATIKRIEKQEDSIRANTDTLRRIEIALVASGIEFVDDDGQYGPRVRFRHPRDS
jgi:transcriptional regulator with XRE-family HTH domain